MGNIAMSKELLDLYT